MIDIGLVPSDTGEKGGQATGRRVGHYIRPDGPFDRSCTELLNAGFVIPYKEVNFWEAIPTTLDPDDPEARKAIELLKQKAEQQRKKKAASKSRYTCPNCHPLIHIWGRPRLRLDCGECGGRFEVDPKDDGWPDATAHE
jgi:hypothetical protein